MDGVKLSEVKSSSSVRKKPCIEGWSECVAIESVILEENIVDFRLIEKLVTA